MRRVLFIIGAVSAIAAVYFAAQHGDGAGAVKRMVRGKSPVGELAHQLQDAWADHHTVA